MAVSLRVYPNLQQRVHSLALISREGSRSKFVCCANPHLQGQGQDKDRLHAEISSSVLRALQPQDSSSSPNPESESLIERNLRKRALANQASSPEQSSPTVGDDVSKEFSCSPGKIGSHVLSPTQDTSAFLSAEQGLALGSGKDSSMEALANPCPISAAFWQETPPGFSMESFHDLDYYATYFRMSLMLHIACADDPQYFNSLPASSLAWLLVPPDGFANSGLPGGRDNFLLQSRREAAENLGKIINNQEILSGATEVFSALWNSKFWTARVTSKKASELVLVLAYSAYVYILSGAANGAPALQKKLEECSMLLNRAVTQLHGPIMDPIGIWDKALKGTSFALNGDAYVYDHALIFPCKLPSKGRIEFVSMLEEVQRRLDKEFEDRDLVALLHRSSDDQDQQFFILIAPWYWVLTLESQQVAPLAGIVAMLSVLATTQFASGGLGFGFAWELYGVSLGWTAILASIFFIQDRQIPAVCPFPSLGALRKISSNYGNLPSRKSVIGAVLKATCAPLAISLLLLAWGAIFWGPSHYTAASVIDYQGYIFVPSDLFAYSGLLTKLLQNFSVQMIQAEDGGSKLAASPFVLAGLLGLNFTAFNLFPGVRTDGSHLLRSLLRSKRLANEVIFVFTVVLTFVLCARNPWLGLAWFALSVFSETDTLVKDDVSEPDLLTSLCGSLPVAGALACFIPLP